MHNFNKIRKISGGAKLSLPETITLSDDIKTAITKSSADTHWLNKLLEGNKNNNGSVDPYMYKGIDISQGISVVGNMAANTVNQNMYRAEEYNKFGQLMSGLSSIPGLQYLGLAKSGVDLITAGLSSQLGNVNMDQGVIERIGGGYSGSVANINRANQISGKNAIGKSHREGVDVIDRANTQMKTMQNIDIDNQTRQALAANTQLNNLRYGQTLSGDFDPKFISIGKNGIKLEYINRVKHLKIKQIVNVNTKQIEEFKNGGSIDEEFTPTIIEEPWIPEIVLDVETFKDGGPVKKSEELVTLEETSQKNVIPEGALHKNKHHIENTEGLTQKGIPVIDNDGEQQAEIELDEIIFTLEVTKKLEELHKLYKEGSNKERDEAAIEAGKLLVQEILYNTDDRTGLIAKCQKGGKL